MTGTTKPMKKIAIGAFLTLLGGVALSSLAHAADKYDETFLAKAADAGSTEIAASKIAQTKGSTPEVKTFAESMVTDHTKVAEELKQLAASKKITVSDEPSKPHQAEIGKLNGLDGKKFDQEYAKKIGVDAHKDAVKLFTEASKKATDPDVKAFATKTLPALEHHLQMATELHTAVSKH